ncbi:MAG: hypothetical protein WD847_02970 [Pirellulales bacterium]
MAMVLALVEALANAPSITEARMAITTIVINSSTSVNPERLRRKEEGGRRKEEGRARPSVSDH